jgi:hypothetical protein
MSNNVVEMIPKAQRHATTPLAEEKAVGPMTWSMESANIGKSTSALIAAVVQTNLQAMQELLRAENPKAMLELQQQFACAYMAVLMRGTMTLVDAIESAAG